ncbi:hypothetical protein [Acidianus manzaensis]|uniref:ArsR family transcriptional regulator n=1 Tax=Acidianus manzaensis TaxID=282676 RepID=A0A1W6K1P2_9CREN|nr:hypothetical protein [Acidianus manzaensis]ARM76419.1 hypothetical protein B6F84_10585 [Acidianus manzaensis]
MFNVLKKKGQISLEDIVLQFEISPATAYNVQRALRAICEQHLEECEVVEKGRRTLFIYRKNEEEEQKEQEEIQKILSAKPEGS